MLPQFAQAGIRTGRQEDCLLAVLTSGEPEWSAIRVGLKAGYPFKCEFVLKAEIFDRS
jgi:hypothetical protein